MSPIKARSISSTHWNWISASWLLAGALALATAIALPAQTAKADDTHTIGKAAAVAAAIVLAGHDHRFERARFRWGQPTWSPRDPARLQRKADRAQWKADRAWHRGRYQKARRLYREARELRRERRLAIRYLRRVDHRFDRYGFGGRVNHNRHDHDADGRCILEGQRNDRRDRRNRR